MKYEKIKFKHKKSETLILLFEKQKNKKNPKIKTYNVKIEDKKNYIILNIKNII